jgi:hypothetical protein
MILLIVAMLLVAALAAGAAVRAYRGPAQSPGERELPQLVFALPARVEQPEPIRAPVDDGRSFAPVRMDEERMIMPARDAVRELAMPPTSDTVRFQRPADEAIQLLPGRLEVLSGLATPREIRLVRIPGERPQMILGREPGGSPQHVALPSSTVSRRHARLDFADGRWELTNLSRTNPVVVNDESLSSTHGERVLMDGDRIELGDVVLRFVAH